MFSRPSVPTLQSELLKTMTPDRVGTFSPEGEYKFYKHDVFVMKFSALSDKSFSLHNSFIRTNKKLFPFIDEHYNLILEKSINLTINIPEEQFERTYTAFNHYKNNKDDNMKHSFYKELLKSVFVKMTINNTYIPKMRHYKIDGKPFNPNYKNIHKVISEKTVRNKDVFSLELYLRDINKDGEEVNELIKDRLLAHAYNQYYALATNTNNIHDIYSYVFDRYFISMKYSEESGSLTWMEKHVKPFYELYLKMVEAEMTATMNLLTNS